MKRWAMIESSTGWTALGVASVVLLACPAARSSSAALEKLLLIGKLRRLFEYRQE
ncbi:uncharacterized protein K460DRAFT_429092 [Cucurbitaria berberidis CBS 394.84]|uniref:Uncharacterized protein n=1 Tax=Cucurbitaria berberidis CBS 394.84 TaxID=1168544 RepID=A0A9P4GN83_9PLEO|nr:uncharacterized protein K460DRAFT_429092 [Cucurbitaria berberidis CBS 394.84]KAF1849558.1 hypothetical protein K460DRAFT_429092 [Cucurbitaria berberidis CBS 394.84]